MSLGAPLAKPLCRPLAGRLVPSPPYDPDAAAYFAAAGVTDAEAKKDLSDWFAGLKALGLYGDLIEMFTMRSAQSVGAGTTAPGMKGVYNASLINGPTWETDGIVLDGTNDYINLGFQSPADNVWFFCCAKRTSGVDGILLGADGVTVSRQFILSATTFGGNTTSLFDTSFRTATEADSGTSFATRGLSKSAAGGTLRYLNKAILSTFSYSAAFNPATQNLLAGARRVSSPANFFTGSISFVAALNGPCDLTIYSAMHDLYKATIGQGLSLL